MKVWLHDNWNVEATVLYDKPPDFFKASSLKEIHNLFIELNDDINNV